MQRAVVAHERAAGQRGQPGLGAIGPRQLIEVVRRVGVGVRRGPDRGQVDAHVPQAWGPGGQGGGQCDPVVGDRTQPAQAPRHMHVRRREDTGAVELVQQPRQRRGPARRRTCRLPRRPSRRASVEEVAQCGHQRGGRAPRPDAAGLVVEGRSAPRHSCRGRTGRARRPGWSRARTRAGASAGSGAARPSRGRPATGSGRPPSRPAALRAGSATP